MEFNKGNYEWWEYFIMPWIAGIVGWGTNVLALQMTFGPIEFFGYEFFRIKGQPWGLIGWQGIIPTKAKKMASVCFDLMSKRLIDTKEIFGRLEPTKFAEVMEDGLLLVVDDIVNEVAYAHFPKVWSTLPQEVKDELIVMTDSACPQFLAAFMKDILENVEEILDIKDMCVKACVRNKKLVVKIFQEVGEKEFIFIRQSGFYFGFLFGSLQMTVWMFYNGQWILPVCGFLVGYITNWVALKIIFRPLEPKKFGSFTLHGVFLKRQDVVSETFARVICVEILHPKAMWNAILRGPHHESFQAMLRAHSIQFTEQIVGGLKPLVLATVGKEEFAQIKEEIATKIMKKLPSIVDRSYEYMTQAFDLENTMKEKMQALSHTEFENVLHPAFQEDEILLIMVGGVLGLIVGVFQLFTLFA